MPRVYNAVVYALQLTIRLKVLKHKVFINQINKSATSQYFAYFWTNKNLKALDSFNM